MVPQEENCDRILGALIAAGLLAEGDKWKPARIAAVLGPPTTPAAVKRWIKRKHFSAAGIGRVAELTGRSIRWLRTGEGPGLRADRSSTSQNDVIAHMAERIAAALEATRDPDGFHRRFWVWLDGERQIAKPDNPGHEFAHKREGGSGASG